MTEYTLFKQLELATDKNDKMLFDSNINVIKNKLTSGIIQDYYNTLNYSKKCIYIFTFRHTISHKKWYSIHCNYNPYEDNPYNNI